MQNTKSVLVGNADSWFGVAAARGLKQCQGIEKVTAGVCNRESEFAKMLEREGVELRVWDLKSVDSIEKCMEGIGSLLLVPNAAHGPTPVSTHIIQAAERSNIENALLWSCANVPELSGTHPTPAPSAGEPVDLEKGRKYLEAMRDLENTFTKSKISKKVVTRISFAMQCLFAFSDVIQNRGFLPLAMGQGRFNPVHLKDVSKASAKILALGIPSEHQNQVYTFTGPRELTARELVDELNKTLQAKITLKDMNLNEFKDTLEQLVKNKQMEEYEKDIMLYENYLISKNKAAKTSTDLKKILQHDPASIDAFFEENKDAFRPGSSRNTSERFIRSL